MNNPQIKIVGDDFLQVIFDTKQIKILIFDIMEMIAYNFLKSNKYIVTKTIQKHQDKKLSFIFDCINKTAYNHGLEFKLNNGTYNRNLFQDKVLTKLFEYVPLFLHKDFSLSDNPEYDLNFNRLKIDCKAKSRKGIPLKSHDATITSNCVKRGKYCDYFLFGTYNRQDIYTDKISFIVLGFISYDDFLSKSHFRPIGVELPGTGIKTRMEEYVINVGSLHNINSFIKKNS